MKTKLAISFGIMLCINFALQAMVIHNYAHEKEESIRNESGIFNEDYLFLGHELNFSGAAEDLVFLGKRLTFNGTTKLGLLCICEKLICSGTSGNGVIAGGMDILINGTVANNSYIGCKSFTLSDLAVVNGNLFVGCAKLALDGKLNGDLYAGAGEIVINNEIRGNVIAYCGRIVIGKKGKIIGNLTYSAKEKLSTEHVARVTGTVTIVESPKSNKDWIAFVKFMKSAGYLICFGLFVSCVIVGSLLLFIPAFKKLDEKQSAITFWKTSLFGLVPVLMYPAIIVLSFILIVTIPLSVMLLMAFVPIFFIAFIIGTTLIGKYLVTRFKWKVEKRHYQFLIGTLAGCIISIIPFIHFLFILFVCSLGWGVFVSFLFKKDLTVGESDTLKIQESVG